MSLVAPGSMSHKNHLILRVAKKAGSFQIGGKVSKTYLSQRTTSRFHNKSISLSTARRACRLEIAGYISTPSLQIGGHRIYRTCCHVASRRLQLRVADEQPGAPEDRGLLRRRGRGGHHQRRRDPGRPGLRRVRRRVLGSPPKKSHGATKMVWVFGGIRHHQKWCAS